MSGRHPWSEIPRKRIPWWKLHRRVLSWWRRRRLRRQVEKGEG